MFGGQFYPRQPIQFMDGLIAPVIGVGLSGVLTYIGQVSNSGSATNSFTFTNAPIGVAATDRLVVGTLLIRSGTAGRVVTGVTFGGVSATLVGSVALDISGGALWAGIFSLLITSGTTSNIVVSCSGNMNEPSIDIYNLNRLQSTTATANPTATSSTGPLTVNPDIPARGILLAGSISTTGSTFTWVGANEDSDTVVGSRGRSAASASGLSVETGRAVTATPSSPGGQVLVAGVWH